jgi:hypothetical protein
LRSERFAATLSATAAAGLLQRAVAEAFTDSKFLVSDNTGASAMNTFYEHHKDNIEFGYRCFDRILLNGLIQPFQQPERVSLNASMLL